MAAHGIVIAIDGVSGSGKSTLAKQLAGKLNYIYLDTGAMYRAVTWKALQSGVDIRDEAKVADIILRTAVTVAPGQRGMRVLIDGTDVSEEIRRPDVSDSVSIVSAYRGVREKLVRLQREFAALHNIVLEGRDVGTVVFPDADVKLFIDASVEERAKRRLAELREKGVDIDMADVMKNIEERDRLDSSRAISPLRKAPDAVIIDSTDLTIEAKTELVFALIRERIPVK